MGAAPRVEYVRIGCVRADAEGRMRFFIIQKHRLKMLLIRIAKIGMSNQTVKAAGKKVLSLFPGPYQKLCRIVREERLRTGFGSAFNVSGKEESIRVLVQSMPEPVYRTYLTIKQQ